MRYFRDTLFSALVLFSLTLTGAQAALLPSITDVLVYSGSPAKTELSSKKIRFLVCNLHKGGDKGFKAEYLSLAMKSDILMNQEIFLDPNMTAIFEFMNGFVFTSATSFFSGSTKIRTGVANASATTPIFTEFITSQTREPITGTPKMTLITTYPLDVDHKNLTVINIHGINFVTNESFKKEMDLIYQKIKNIPSPLVFAGDFNTWNDKRLSILEEYCKKMGLREASFSPDERLTFNDHPLDHFFYSKDLKILNARVDKSYIGSDHKPLQVTLEYISE